MLNRLLREFRFLNLPQWITALSTLATLAMVTATFRMVWLNQRNLSLTTELVESGQRPMFYWELKNSYSAERLKEDTTKIEISPIYLNNTGKGPAFKLTRNVWIDNQKEPSKCDTIVLLPMDVYQTIWPGQNIEDRFRAKVITRIDSCCTRYLHVVNWYKDRFNNNYLEERVLFGFFVNYKMDKLADDRYFTFNFKTHKWE